MSGALKTIGTIAGAVALVAGTIATGGLGSPALVAAMGKVATYAGLAAGVASIGAQALYKPPPARGSVTNVLIAADAPSPYVMGEGYFGGVMRHDVAYGATLKKVPNPYRWIVSVYSVGGPVQSISPRVELAATSSYYSTFLYTDTQLGLCPESSGLAPHFAGAPGWNTATARLSGQAAIGWNLKFDKDGKVFATGVPRLGAYGQWVRVYDPRKDSTFPGGSGSHRLGVESTYEWSQNPALHAGTYASGRYQNGKRVFGIGLPAEGIDLVGIAAWANVCDANGWTIFGVAFEPGDRWAILNDICAAGGGRPAFASGRLSWLWSAPKVALDTITDADIADDSYSVTAMTSWRDRLNSIVPKYRSPDHDWEMVPQETAISVPAYVEEDGELKQVEWPFNFVKGRNQAAQLAAYKMLDSRELQPITLPCLPRLRKYRPGECLHIELPELGLDTDAVILTREFDPARMVVTLTLMGETPEKHDFALGRTGTAPPTPALKQTVEERDLLRWSAMLDNGARTIEYSDLTEYSQGMVIRLPDGSTWEYIAETPDSGNPPPLWPFTVNDHWQNLTPPLAPATDISPTPPLTLPPGAIWFSPNGHPYRFDSRPWIGADGTPWIGADGEAWLGSGYTSVQDDLVVEAAENAAEAEAQAAAALSQIATVVADGILDRGEKPSVKLEYDALLSEQPGIQNNATYYAITTQRTVYDAAITALTVYMVGLTPSYSDYTQDTSIDRSTFNATWKAAYDTRQALLDEIAVQAGRSAATLTPAPALNILCDYLGVPKDGQLPRTIVNIRKRGNANVNALTTWSATIPDTITGSIDTTAPDSSRGSITITAFNGAGGPTEILVDSSYDGIALSGKISISPVLDAPPPPPPPSGSVSTSAQSNVSQSNSNHSYAATGVVIGPVRAPASGQIKLEAVLSFIRNATGVNDGQGKWGYATAEAGPFTDVPGGEAMSSSVCRRTQIGGGPGGDPPEFYDTPGSLSVIVTQSSLTPGTDYWFTFRPRKVTTTSGSTGASCTFSGLKKATQA